MGAKLVAWFTAMGFYGLAAFPQRGTRNPREVSVPPGSLRLHPLRESEPGGDPPRTRVRPGADPWQGAGARRPRARPGIGARRDRDRGPAGATPRLPRRADPRVRDRGHVLGSTLRASRGDRRGKAPRIEVRRPHPPSRFGTGHGFAAP